jgi:16S rRNA (cytosine967-C5)-methyltransferase
MDARVTALSALIACRKQNAWSDGVLKEYIVRDRLDRRDAALASRLCYGVLQNRMLLDFYISHYLNARLRDLEPAVLDILRLGVCQILFMDRVPDSAAVDTGVQLCRDAGYARAAGLVNAVLRRVAENKADLPAVPGAGTAKYLAVLYSHPEWLAQRLIKEHGYGFTESFFAADNSPAELCVQTNTLKCTAAELAGHLTDAGISCRAHPWAEDALLVENPGNVEKLPGFAEGLFYVQDPAAAFTAATLGLQSGMRVLDVCAAPGGKSFAAAIRMRNKGEIVARDIHEKKLGLISRGAEAAGHRYHKHGIPGRPGERRRGFRRRHRGRALLRHGRHRQKAGDPGQERKRDRRAAGDTAGHTEKRVGVRAPGRGAAVLHMHGAYSGERGRGRRVSRGKRGLCRGGLSGTG